MCDEKIFFNALKIKIKNVISDSLESCWKAMS
jgi:hypothetical protein